MRQDMSTRDASTCRGVGDSGDSQAEQAQDDELQELTTARVREGVHSWYADFRQDLD